MNKNIPVALQNVTAGYGDRPVLRNVNLRVAEGKITAIAGPAGSGKSTLIRSIMGFLELSSGRVEVYGKSVGQQRSLLGYVPQCGSVYCDYSLTVRNVVMMGLRNVEAALDATGLSSMADQPISEVSGAVQQRVFLARALAQESRIYLMDEPVDASIIQQVRALREKGKTTLVAHRDFKTARSYCDDLFAIDEYGRLDRQNNLA